MVRYVRGQKEDAKNKQAKNEYQLAALRPDSQIPIQMERMTQKPVWRKSESPIPQMQAALLLLRLRLLARQTGRLSLQKKTSLHVSLMSYASTERGIGCSKICTTVLSRRTKFGGKIKVRCCSVDAELVQLYI